MNTKARKPMTLKKKVIITIIGMVCLFFILHDVMQATSDLKQMHSQPQFNAVQRQQADTFIAGYEKTMGPIESEEEAHRVGKAAAILCTYLDNDPSLEGAWTYGTDKLELSSDQAVAVIDNGIHAFCPRHTPLLQAGE